MTNITFFNLSRPIMPKCFKKKLCDRSWDIRINNFGTNWAQILFLLEKGVFLEKLTNNTIFYLLCPIMLQCLRKTLADHNIRYWNFGPNSTQIIHLPLQGIFFKKSHCYLYLLRYPITILQCLKRSWKWITKYKAA